MKIGWSREVKERARQTGGDEREAGRQRRVGKAGRQAEKSRERERADDFAIRLL